MFASLINFIILYDKNITVQHQDESIHFMLSDILTFY